MKNNIKKLLLVSLATILVSCGTTTNSESLSSSEQSSEYVPQPNDRTWEITSIDKSLKLNVYLKGGYVTYEVFKDDKEVVGESGLLIMTDSTGFEYGVEYYDETEITTISTTYENISGSYSEVSTACNEIIISLIDVNDMLWDLTFRVYDDGYALRHGISSVDGSSGSLTFYGEETTWALPKNSRTYGMDFNTTPAHPYFSYEEFYARRSANNIEGANISMPFLYKTNDDVWSLITESELMGSQFYGSFLTGIGDRVIQTIPAYGAEKEGTEGITVNYPFEMPWRVCPTGSLADIVESSLVEDVYDDVEYWKPDNYNELTNEEKAIYNYDWVEPGIVAWNWLSYTGKRPQNDWDLHKEYIDLAYEMGWKYIILDGGWDNNISSMDSMAGFMDMMRYANSKNVKVIAWGNGLTKTSPAALETVLNQWQLWGIAGVKLDFFDGQAGTLPNEECGESQATVVHYEKIYQECAKRKMVVNCHGGNKPTGERRIYPHVLNREGIRGNEMKSMQAEQLVTIPFIRGVVGPSDYTPVLKPFTQYTTMGMQLAQCVLYESGLPSMADKCDVYYNSIAKDFLKALPATWDDLKYLGGEPMDSCVIARRKGNEWWIAGIGTDAKEFALNLSFLDEGVTYNADIYTDGTSYDTIKNSKQQVNSNSTLAVSIAKNGGFAIRLTK